VVRKFKISEVASCLASQFVLVCLVLCSFGQVRVRDITIFGGHGCLEVSFHFVLPFTPRNVIVITLHALKLSRYVVSSPFSWSLGPL